MTKKQVDTLGCQYFKERERWGENNLTTQRAFIRWIDAKGELEKQELKKQVNSLIENPRRWWKTPCEALAGETPQNVLDTEPERIKRMIYFLQSGEPG